MFEQSEIHQVAEKKGKEDDYRQKIISSLEQAGINEYPGDEIIERLVLLEKESKFNEDARLIERGMANILNLLEERYAKDYPQFAISPKQKNEGRLAAILHDIGKSGPVQATEQEQKSIVKLFSREEIKDPQYPVGDMINESFHANEKEEALENLKNCGISPETTIREFWDKHAQWTHDILEKYPKGIDSHVRKIAASHHIDHGINPYNLSESEIPFEASIIGTLENYVDALEERILIAVDQYEAIIRRRGSAHETALACVRQNLHKYRSDQLMIMVFNALDELGAQGKLFY